MTDLNNKDLSGKSLPYLFISYSHKDCTEMEAVKQVLDNYNIRYWYDNGLRSGDDWNYEIAVHLQNATACLLLLSFNSSNSEYVKNELNFAQSHRIPIHILLLHHFELPIDIEIMTGRIQMFEMTDDYCREFIKSLPGEVFVKNDSIVIDEQRQTHPLFVSEALRSDRQGTKVYEGYHKQLRYPCAIVEDVLQKGQLDETKELLVNMSAVRYPVFPMIYDVNFEGTKMVVYQQFSGGAFLDEYLEEHILEQDTIIRWIEGVVEGISGLYKMRYAFRDLARGSLIVDENDNLRIFRLYNPYYGVVKVSEETRQYYFEKNLQEIAVLLAQLCVGKVPVLPIGIIENKSYDKGFLTKINVIIQKCTKQKGVVKYSSFDEIIQDLHEEKCRIQDVLFLQGRKKKLRDYAAAKRKAKESEQLMAAASVNNGTKGGKPFTSIENKFGFDETITQVEQSDNEQCKISVLICSTDKVYNFDKDEIIVGRGNQCDLIWTQPAISRIHLKIRYHDAASYIVTDLNSSNGTYISSYNRLESGTDVIVNKGSTLRIGELEMKLL